MKGNISLGPAEILFLSDGNNTVGIVKAALTKHVFIETDQEELVQFMGPDDLIAASCFLGGKRARSMIECMLFLVREGKVPLLVLRKDHPATKRLPLVVSAGERIVLSSCIIPGTHPEQDVLCGRGEMDGMKLKGTPGMVDIDGGGSPEVEKASFNVQLQK